MATYENGQWVDTTTTTTLSAGELHLGEVGGVTTSVQVTLTLPAEAVDDNDVLAATQEVANAVRVNAGSGVIHTITLLDADDNTAELDIVFLQTNVALGTEDAAVSITDANAMKILGIQNIATTDWCDLINNKVATITNAGIVIEAAAASTSIYVAVITRTAITTTASGLVLRLGILQD